MALSRARDLTVVGLKLRILALALRVRRIFLLYFFGAGV